MKKILTLTIVFLSAVTLMNAQNPVSIGIRAGVNFQNINGKESNGSKLQNGLTTGFNAGVTADIPIGVDFYLQPGILYSLKGAKLKNYEYMGQRFNGDLKLSYVEIPVSLLYKPVLGKGKLLVGFGPYVAFGIGGKADLTNPSRKYDVKYKKDVTSSDLATTPFYYKPLDAGANIFAGYQFNNKFSVQLNSQLGLIKLNSTINGVEQGDAAHKNTGFGVSLGYRLK
jgi:hypothetical protein